ncbi:MAG: divalent-cation tolerance protein CutA [Elusimicrobia bacterium]|nr:divalent-cation tolerance protein CutA [Elusimicrobiota bacterium]MDE2237451.1 divalent-cation tolerance protein CutA [Elusimicrobiota bacterium]MDE2424511.1 divalent-cation tolerance protein CutA [Elusimicrobiota bacterium]
MRLVLITAPGSTLARSLAKELVRRRLAACVNLLPGATSYYVWKGRLNEDRECLLLAKTAASALPALKRFVRSRHPADVPEIISLSIAGGDASYLQWVAASATGSARRAGA